MNRLPKPKDNIEEQKQRNNSQPKIFFGLEELGYYTGKVKDNEAFLSLDDFNNKLRNLSKMDTVVFSESFITAIKIAQNRIWLIDEYLHCSDDKDKENLKLNRLLNHIKVRMQYVDDVRFFFKDDSHRKETSDLLNNELKLKNYETINYRFFCYENFHDRFAIIDDVLWHFGSDVGASSLKLNATSYGWDAKYFNAINFFEAFWEEEYVK